MARSQRLFISVATECLMHREFKVGAMLLTHLQKVGGCTLDGRWYHHHLHPLGSELQEEHI